MRRLGSSPGRWSNGAVVRGDARRVVQGHPTKEETPEVERDQHDHQDHRQNERELWKALASGTTLPHLTRFVTAHVVASNTSGAPVKGSPAGATLLLGSQYLSSRNALRVSRSHLTEHLSG